MNPREMVMNYMKNNVKSNPMMSNLIQMAQQGNSQGIEQFARNLCREKRN